MNPSMCFLVACKVTLNSSQNAEEDATMYFAPIMIDIKKRLGHILQERGLVMRGEESGGELSLNFQTDDKDRRLDISLTVQGKSDTKARSARWEHAYLTADIYEDVRLGDTGYYCHLHRCQHEVYPDDFDTEEDFIAEVGAYLQECMIVNFGYDDSHVANEIAVIYLELVDIFAPTPPEFNFERKGKEQHLTVSDAEGKVFDFATAPGGILQVSINGTVIEEIYEAEQWHIQEVLSGHFTTAKNLKRLQ
jgi:hypothetical protein